MVTPLLSHNFVVLFLVPTTSDNNNCPLLPIGKRRISLMLPDFVSETIHPRDRPIQLAPLLSHTLPTKQATLRLSSSRAEFLGILRILISIVIFILIFISPISRSNSQLRPQNLVSVADCISRANYRVGCCSNPYLASLSSIPPLSPQALRTPRTSLAATTTTLIALTKPYKRESLQ